MKTNSLISSTQTPNNGVFISIDSIGVFLTIMVSVSILVTVGIKLISKFNHLNYSIKDLQDEIDKHSQSEGHERLIARVQQLENLDKRLDLHIQDYINRKDTVQMLLGQLNEKIDHKSLRLHTSVRDIEKFLLREGSFKIRDSSEDISE